MSDAVSSAPSSSGASASSGSTAKVSPSQGSSSSGPSAKGTAPKAGTAPAAGGKPQVSVKPTLQVSPKSVPQSTEGSEAATSGDQDTPETPAEKRARRLKLKIDGQEEEFDVDAASDEDLALQLQMGRAARKRMQEAAEERKKAQTVQEKFQEILALGKEDPAGILEGLFGVNPHQWAEQLLLQKYQEEQMPEADRKALHLERQLAQRDAELKKIADERAAQEKAVKDAEAKTLQEKYEREQFEAFDKEYAAALSKHSLPKTKETAWLMAQVGKVNLEHGVELSADQMANEVKKRFTAIHQGVVGQLDGAQLLDVLGQDVVRKVLKASLEKVGKKAPSSPGVSPFAKQPQVEEPDEVKPKRRMLSDRDWNKAFK